MQRTCLPEETPQQDASEKQGSTCEACTITCITSWLDWIFTLVTHTHTHTHLRTNKEKFLHWKFSDRKWHAILSMAKRQIFLLYFSLIFFFYFSLAFSPRLRVIKVLKWAEETFMPSEGTINCIREGIKCRAGKREKGACLHRRQLLALS